VEEATLAPPTPTPGLNDPMVLKEKYDYVVVSTKQLPERYSVATLIAPLITPSFTSIVLIQNGLNVHLPLIKAFTQNVTMSAVSMIGSFTEGTNKIKHIGHDILQIGSHYHAGIPDSISMERTQAFIDMYNAGGAKECTLAPDMPRARYQKLLWNGTYNTVRALKYMDCGEIQRSGEREKLVIPLMRENWNVARADGHDLPEELIQHMAFRSLETSRYRPSMLLDREHRRHMEFEVILGDPIKRAAELGIQASIMTTVYELLEPARERVQRDSEV
jgi:2-dehydropantoate 2-reductase